MRTRSLAVVAAAALAPATVLLAPPAFAAPPSGRPFSIELTGAAERPDPGDVDASGTARLRVNPGLEQLCYELSVDDIDGDVVAAHVHVGSVDEAGGVVVTLQAPVDGSSSDCVDVTRDLARAIVSNPTNYYVNVHSTVYPAGAVRGQLR